MRLVYCEISGLLICDLLCRLMRFAKKKKKSFSLLDAEIRFERSESNVALSWVMVLEKMK